MSKKVTEHTTGLGAIQFMAAARPLLNAKAGKEEYSIKVKLQTTDQSVDHLKQIADYKIDTKTNRALAGTGETVVNFTSSFAPKVVGVDNTELTGQDIPFFDGRTDTGNAVVSYKVIDYGTTSIVRLSGIKLMDLTLAPREDKGQSLDVTLDTLKNIG